MGGWVCILLSMISRVLCAVVGMLCGSTLVFAQSDIPTDSVTIAPGPEYVATSAERFFFGNHYRDLWTTPIRVPVLDLETFGGGLTPVRAHQGSQTKSLRFEGKDGRQYAFRLVDKFPTARLDPRIRESLIGKGLQDQTSATHPVASLVAAPLLEAAGVLHVEPMLVVMPDDRALGPYRKEFAGTLGFIEERPNELEDREESFAGAEKVIGSTRLFERIDDGPDDLVDARAFLKARLMDIYLGDRDRHRDQWRWALFNRNKPRMWEPISRDHDEAFVRMDGLFPWLTRIYFLQLVSFGPHYPNIVRLHWNAREVDRRFLAGLERPVWDSVVHELTVVLTDAVIEDAVRHLPPEMYELNGAELIEALLARRDRLPEIAGEFYGLLAEDVEIYATNAAEVAEVVREDDRYLTVSVRLKDRRSPFFLRRFDSHETDEIRLRMRGGGDRVVVRGAGDPGITLRILGGTGRDEFADSSRVGGVHFYDQSRAVLVAAGRGTGVDSSYYKEWVGSDTTRYPPRDWGAWWGPLPWASLGPDVGLFIGGGVVRYGYGFRKDPYGSRWSLRAGYASEATTFRVELNGEVRRENSDVFARVQALASGIEVLRYYGLGNNTRAPGNRRFFRVRQQQFHLQPEIVVPAAPELTLSFGPVVRYATLSDNDGRFIETLRDTLYGANDFGETGARFSVAFDTRDNDRAPGSGLFIQLDGNVYAPVWDVQSTFGSLGGAAAGYVRAPGRFEPTLAMRAGARKVFGRFPFHESAFLGGADDLRGWDQDRFAGDLALYGNAELRLFLSEFNLLLPGDFGVFGLTDVGRVYVDGDSPGGWHTGVGGGVWFAFLSRVNVVSVGLAHGTERTSVYAKAGFGF